MRDDLPQHAGDRPQPQGLPPAGRVPRTLGLRILATTDLHMQLLGHDYVADRSVGHHGLAGLARLIGTARQEAEARGWACLLLDNGDTFQGNALGDGWTQCDSVTGHPGVAACNHLRYDAVGVGNHDLDHGVAHLQRIATALRMPVISSNLHLDPPGPIRTSALIRCDVPNRGQIRVGLVSVLPEHTAIWNGQALGHHNRVLPAARAVTAEVARLREQEGAQLIVLMAHMGIEQGQIDNAAHLAELDGIDALITGHTHRRFPGQDHTAARGVDPADGSLAGRPAIMPGHHGSDLGILDLMLTDTGTGRLRITAQHSSLRPNAPCVEPEQPLVALCRPAHDHTRKTLRQTVSHTTADLHNFFSLAMPTATCALIAGAQVQVIRAALVGTPEAALPLVCAVPAQTAGGLGGPLNYLHIPRGPILRRHVAGLAPYADRIWALEITGAELRDWLERAARIYMRLSRGRPEQPLVDRSIPPFHFDTIYGLNYVIDPSRPAGQRILDLTHEGSPVAADQPFVLVTNQFRGAGGGGYTTGLRSRIIHRSREPIMAALMQYLDRPGDCAALPAPMPWRLSCGGKVRTLFETTPKAANHLTDAAPLKPRLIGTSAAGFAILELTL